MSSLPLSQVKVSFLLATIAEGGLLPVKVLCGHQTSPEVSRGCCSPAVRCWSPVCSPVVTANTYLWWQLVNVRERRWTGRRERQGGEKRSEGGARVCNKSRTQLTNTWKIPTNEDRWSSRDVVRWRSEGGEVGLWLIHQWRKGRGKGMADRERHVMSSGLLEKTETRIQLCFWKCWAQSQSSVSHRWLFKSLVISQLVGWKWGLPHSSTLHYTVRTFYILGSIWIGVNVFL